MRLTPVMFLIPPPPVFRSEAVRVCHVLRVIDLLYLTGGMLDCSAQFNFP